MGLCNTLPGQNPRHGNNPYNGQLAAFLEELACLRELPISCRGIVKLQLFSIDAVGNVYPCQALHYSKLCFGNVRLRSFQEIIENSQEARIFRKFDLTRVSKCKKCKLRMLCGGGCRAVAFALYRHLDAYNKFLCPFLQKELEGRIWKSMQRPILEHIPKYH